MPEPEFPLAKGDDEAEEGGPRSKHGGESETNASTALQTHLILVKYRNIFALRQMAGP
jgi:hypothetical protein